MMLLKRPSITAASTLFGLLGAVATVVIGGCSSQSQLETGANAPAGTTRSADGKNRSADGQPMWSDGSPSGSAAASVASGAVDRSPIDPLATADASIASPGTSGVPNAAPISGRGFKVALLLPLGGFDQTAVISKGMKQAVELALFEAERSDVQLIVKDDKGTPEGARAAAEEAVKEGAEVILGPLLGRTVPGAAAVARASNMPVLAFSNDRTVAGNGVYVLGFSPEQDADRVVDYAARHNKQRFAALVPNDAYGSVIGDAFKAAVAKAGGSVVAFETYPAGANAMIGPSRRIVEAARAAEGTGTPIDAVFLPGGQDVLPQLGPLLTYSGFDAGKVKLIGSGAWEFATLGSNDAFIGGWYPGPDPAGWRTFQAKFTKNFGQSPPRVASIAYDAMQLAMSLSSQPTGQRFTTANLTRPGGFTGVDGPFRLTVNGYVERSLAILEVQKIGSQVIEAAPSIGSSNLDGARLSGTPPRVN